MPLVRVVIPTYNRSSLLKEALESVLVQSLCNLEVIVVDDGSTDDTEELVRKIAIRDTRIRYIKQLNCGSSTARNRAIKESGECSYVAFLDSDDLWCPRHLEESVAVLEKESAVALVFSRVTRVDLTGKHWPDTAIRDRDRRLQNLLRYSTPSTLSRVCLINASVCHHALLRSEFAPHTSTVVVRRSAVLRSEWFNPKLAVLEDVEFFLHLAASHLPFAFIDRTAANVRHYGDNLTGNHDLSSPSTLRRYRSVLQYCNMKLELYSLPEDLAFISREISGAAYLVAQCCAEQLDLLSARRAYSDSLRYQVSYKALKGFLCSLLPPSVYSLLRASLKPLKSQRPSSPYEPVK